MLRPHNRNLDEGNGQSDTPPAKGLSLAGARIVLIERIGRPRSCAIRFYARATLRPGGVLTTSYTAINAKRDPLGRYHAILPDVGH
jgi:hypothetical protein